MPLGAMPVGTIVHNVETKPGKGGSLARSAGTYAMVAGRDQGFALLKLKSGETRMVDAACMATVGAVSNPDHINEVIGKAGRNRWKGARSVSRGIARNPVDHPNGGRTNGGKHWATPWGKPKRARRPVPTSQPTSHRAQPPRSQEIAVEVARDTFVLERPVCRRIYSEKADVARAAGRHSAIKTWSRRSTILPQFVGLTFQVHNGNKFFRSTFRKKWSGTSLVSSRRRGPSGPLGFRQEGNEGSRIMSKPVRKRSLADNEAKAVTVYPHQPAQAQRTGHDHPWHEGVQALAELTFSRRRIAKDVKKTLESAIANAENNHDLDINNLVVAEAWVGKNLVMKRFMPGARGRVGKIEKFFSELTIIVREVKEAA